MALSLAWLPSLLLRNSPASCFEYINALSISCLRWHLCKVGFGSSDAVFFWIFMLLNHRLSTEWHFLLAILLVKVIPNDTLTFSLVGSAGLRINDRSIEKSRLLLDYERPKVFSLLLTMPWSKMLFSFLSLFVRLLEVTVLPLCWVAVWYHLNNFDVWLLSTSGLKMVCHLLKKSFL